MNLFQLFIGSFHSAAAYRHMRKTATFGMGYALVLVLVTTLFVTVYYSAFIHRELFAARDGKTPFFDDIVQQIVTQVPLTTLHEHSLQTATEEPTTITISGTAFGESFTNFPLITIDTSGTTDYESTDSAMLITHKDIYIRKRDKTEVLSIAELTKDSPNTLVITRAMAQELGEKFTRYVHEHLLTFFLVLGAIAWFFIAAFMYVMRIIMLLLLGLVGLGIASVIRVNLTYAASVSLASLSYTAIALLDTALFTVVRYPTSSTVLLLAGSVALFAAIKASDTPDPSQRVG